MAEGSSCTCIYIIQAETDAIASIFQVGTIMTRGVVFDSQQKEIIIYMYVYVFQTETNSIAHIFQVDTLRKCLREQYSIHGRGQRLYIQVAVIHTHSYVVCGDFCNRLNILGGHIDEAAAGGVFDTRQRAAVKYMDLCILI